MQRCLGLIALSWLASCAGPTIDPLWAEAAGRRHDEPIEEPVPAAALLSGFDSPRDAPPAKGDSVLFGITFEEQGEDTERWTVHLEVTDDELRNDAGKPRKRTFRSSVTHEGKSRVLVHTSELVLVRLRVFDGAGAPIGEDTAAVGRDFLRTGFLEACDAKPDAKRSPIEDPAVETRASATAALLAFMDLIRGNRHLSKIMWRVIRTPSLWSIVTNFGVSISILAKFDEAEHDAAALAGHEIDARRFPLHVTGNDQPLLLASLRVVEPKSPFGLAAGIVSMVAVRPGRESSRVTIRLLAARRSR